MPSYLYETHVHTCQGSACGRATGREQVRFYKELGYQGIIVTDHFFGGNTAVRHNLPWKTRVEWFCSGYEDAKAEGDRIGLDVFMGLEQNYQGDEYLIYGLDKAYLLEHPEMEQWSRRQQLEEVHRAGGCVIQAHPFRDRDYIWYLLLARQFVDGVEVANAGNLPYNDAAAYRYAQAYGFPMTAGSDNHYAGHAKESRDAMMGVILPERLTCIQDYVRMIREHQPISLHVPPGRFDLTGKEPILESYWLDDEEKPYPTGLDWLHPTT